MTNKNLALVLFVFGAVFLFFSFTGRFSFLVMLLGLAMLGGGFILRRTSYTLSKQTSDSSIPLGFNATHRHKNIAIDAMTKNLWLRDENGATCILIPSDVLGWDIETKSLQKTFAGGNMAFTGAPLHGNCKLRIKTSNLDHPVYRVKFNAHSDALASGNRKNYQEIQEWSDRLTAFYRR